MIKLMGFATTDGSPPLTRGKLVIAAIAALVARLIPAHAGKTTLKQGVIAPPSAHPRSRGENVKRRPRFSRGLGSSPLTRGKPEGTRRRGGGVGSSPLTRGKRQGRRRAGP